MRKFKACVILFFLFVACQKEVSNDKPDAIQNTKTIVGQWEWVISAGALTSTITPQSSGHTWGLRFNSDSTCIQTGSRFPNGTATYSLKEYLYGFYWNPIYCILFPFAPSYRYLIKSADSLLIADPATSQGQDGPVHLFLRK